MLAKSSNYTTALIVIKVVNEAHRNLKWTKSPVIISKKAEVNLLTVARPFKFYF